MGKPMLSRAIISREVRVFVSSTFSDMQAEREELVKRVFPRLRKLCESRGVTWGEVDLRWGVPDEGKADGNVLPICLAEIERCRPFFLALLGERYGSVPEAINPTLIHQQEWISEHRSKSVTEIEILHGALNHPSASGHAFFYLRDPSYIDSLPASEQSRHREEASLEDVVRFGTKESERRALDRRQKLAALKQRILASGLPVRAGYPNPQALGDLVLADLTEVIEQLFPVSSVPDTLDREAEAHEAFARSRTNVYVERRTCFDILDWHAEGHEPPLVIAGAAGAGKSALLANWALRYRRSHPSLPMLIHFAAASPSAANWSAMIRRILGELQRSFGVDVENPAGVEELRIAFANALHVAAAGGRCVMLIDGLDQLDDSEGALDLAWLPPVIPSNIRLIVSTSSGRTSEELARRGWPTLEVDALTPAEREHLIVEYLAQYGKKLDPPLLKQIVQARQAANPLFVRSFLEELRLWGDHHTLREQLDDYLAAPDLDVLYEKILGRYERDYDRERPGLTQEAMSLLWGARRGLAEVELLDLLGRNGIRLPNAVSSPLLLAAEWSFINRSGLITFSHEYMRAAIERRYLATVDAGKAIHERLAGYFAGHEWSVRKIDELPWQLERAESWTRLSRVLADSTFLERAMLLDRNAPRGYWAKVEANSSLRAIDAYADLLASPRESAPEYVVCVADLLSDIGPPNAALWLWRNLTELCKQKDRRLWAASLGKQAAVLETVGDYDAAMRALKQEEQIHRELDDKTGLVHSLISQAVVLKNRGQFDEAMKLHTTVEQMSRDLGDRRSLALSLVNKGGLLRISGAPEQALGVYAEAEAIFRECGDRIALAGALTNQAIILANRGDLNGALALYAAQVSIFRQLGDKSGLATCLVNQGAVLRVRGSLDGAMAAYQEAEQNLRAIGDRRGLAHVLVNRAVILELRGNFAEALASSLEAAQICRDLQYMEGLASALGLEAHIHRIRGDLETAMKLASEKERICRELGDQRGIAGSLDIQARILYDRGDYAGALTLHTNEEKLYRELGDMAGVQAAIANQGLQHRLLGDLGMAMSRYKEAEQLCRDLGFPEALATHLGNQAVIYHLMGEIDLAAPLHQQAIEMCRELGDRITLQGLLGNQAMTLAQSGATAAALGAWEEQERISRELGHPTGLSMALGGRATLLRKLGQEPEALTLAREARLLVRRYGLAAVEEQIAPILRWAESQTD
jgi:tetratricopeptide (TPR) repeat protein